MLGFAIQRLLQDPLSMRILEGEFKDGDLVEIDLETGKLVLDALRHANRSLGTLTVVITHNAGIAAMADRVIRLRSGLIVEESRNASPVVPSALSW